MSFFGHLLAGVAGGAADGYSAGLAQQEKMDLQRQMQAERQQASMDRLLQQQEFRSALAAERANGGGGKGKAERDVFGDVLGYMEKGDQQGLDQYIKAMSAFSGEAGNQLRASLATPQADAQGGMQWPTEKDVLASMGEPSASVPELPKNATRGEKERLMGERALQQMAVLFRDPAKLDDYAKAVRQLALNHFGAENAAQVMERGGSLPDASAAFQKYSSTADDSEKNRLRQAAIDASNERTKSQADAAGARNASANARALEKQIAEAYKAKDAARPSQKADHQKRINQLEARRDALEGAALAPALNSYEPGATTTAPSPTAVLPSPASRAAAWKSRFGAAQ